MTFPSSEALPSNKRLKLADVHLIVEAGDTMRLVATGDVPRRSLVLILYDAARLPMQIIEVVPVLKVCS